MNKLGIFLLVIGSLKLSESAAFCTIGLKRIVKSAVNRNSFLPLYLLPLMLAYLCTYLHPCLHGLVCTFTFIFHACLVIFVKNFMNIVLIVSLAALPIGFKHD
ncbi:hypothetical protein CUMW_072570 [Citrus unshiu]|uniref:Uncharacterized protein n=1 Tax=Citrus sinensis TaxID=2711 RepID=A0A067DV07_CITSI|nr:hypothetical protein CISIN_1g039108mg [Citrus sinensis]GAY43185.1 hypothetical protein CUMW_072570 [Citrus unshiu]